ncbi:MAG: hypothetical protein LUG98_05195, partial [Tannerellaceae bacterium]|nr:hypothetical protein [Tannerellaceae bacterium]
MSIKGKEIGKYFVVFGVAFAVATIIACRFEKHIKTTQDHYMESIEDLRAQISGKINANELGGVSLSGDTLQVQLIYDKINEMILHYNSSLNAADSRISRELNNLNIWVTIWMGLIALGGIFIPLVLNNESNKKLESLKREYK